jgi:uncharacterized protein YjbJ (UPF0337 family)
MDKDEIKGKAKEATGYIKEKAGEMMNDPDLETEGEVEKAEGKVQHAWGKAKDTARDVVDEAEDTASDVAGDAEDAAHDAKRDRDAA